MVRPSSCSRMARQGKAVENHCGSPHHRNRNTNPRPIRATPVPSLAAGCSCRDVCDKKNIACRSCDQACKGRFRYRFSRGNETGQTSEILNAGVRQGASFATHKRIFAALHLTLLLAGCGDAPLLQANIMWRLPLMSAALSLRWRVLDLTGRRAP